LQFIVLTNISNQMLTRCGSLSLLLRVLNPLKQSSREGHGEKPRQMRRCDAGSPFDIKYFLNVAHQVMERFKKRMRK
jgi:hypothetical protein